MNLESTIVLFVGFAGFAAALVARDDSLKWVLSILGGISVITLFFWKINFAFGIILGAIPLGIFVAWLSADELKIGKKWFISVVVIGLLGGLIFLLLNERLEAYSLFALGVLALGAIYANNYTSWNKIRGSKV